MGDQRVEFTAEAQRAPRSRALEKERPGPLHLTRLLRVLCVSAVKISTPPASRTDAGCSRFVHAVDPSSDQTADGCVAMRVCRSYNAPRLILHAGARGEVPERSIGTVSKTVVPSGVPWVRIPPSPPKNPTAI